MALEPLRFGRQPGLLFGRDRHAAGIELDYVRRLALQAFRPRAVGGIGHARAEDHQASRQSWDEGPIAVRKYLHFPPQSISQVSKICVPYAKPKVHQQRERLNAIDENARHGAAPMWLKLGDPERLPERTRTSRQLSRDHLYRGDPAGGDIVHHVPDLNGRGLAEQDVETKRRRAAVRVDPLT